MNRAVKITAVVLGLVLVTAGKCDVKPPPADIPTDSTPNGEPSPGAVCTFEQLGHKTVYDGQIIQCQEPRPYKWRTVK